MTAANAHATLPSAAAPLFGPGLVHVPCTPFTASGAVDHDAHARLIDFHLAHGAQALALPMHAGDSVSLTTPERHRLLE
ncbi:MAG: dihydrodipicolinate synthase family protein, partial [bacterium]